MYRPDIDGLRCVAVLVVILHHLNSETVPCGFIGVDVFFVISGYLITGVLLRDLDPRRAAAGKRANNELLEEKNWKSFFHVDVLHGFWLRRMRRILPALLFLFVPCMVFVLLFFTRFDRVETSEQFVAAWLFSAHWYLQNKDRKLLHSSEEGGKFEQQGAVPKAGASAFGTGGEENLRWFTEPLLRQVWPGLQSSFQKTFVASDPQHFDDPPPSEVKTRGYFETEKQQEVFRHLWSLSVEEQFYFVWPFAVVGVFVLVDAVLLLGAPGKTRGHLVYSAQLFLLFLVAASYGLHSWRSSYRVANLQAFYFSTRSWQILSGCVVSVAENIFSVIVVVLAPSSGGREAAAGAAEGGGQVRIAVSSQEVGGEKRAVTQSNAEQQGALLVLPMVQLASSEGRGELPAPPPPAPFPLPTSVSMASNASIPLPTRTSSDDVDIHTSRSMNNSARTSSLRFAYLSTCFLAELSSFLSVYFILHAASTTMPDVSTRPLAARATIESVQLMAITGSVLFVSLGSCCGASQIPFLHRIVASSPMVAIGLVSYGWYLWHFPVLVFAKYVTLFSTNGPLEDTWRGWNFVFLFSLFLAFLSYRYIETPARNPKRPAFLISVHCLGCCFQRSCCQRGTTTTGEISSDKDPPAPSSVASDKDPPPQQRPFLHTWLSLWLFPLLCIYLYTRCFIRDCVARGDFSRKDEFPPKIICGDFLTERNVAPLDNANHIGIPKYQEIWHSRTEFISPLIRSTIDPTIGAYPVEVFGGVCIDVSADLQGAEQELSLAAVLERSVSPHLLAPTTNNDQDKNPRPSATPISWTTYNYSKNRRANRFWARCHRVSHSLSEFASNKMRTPDFRQISRTSIFPRQYDRERTRYGMSTEHSFYALSSAAGAFLSEKEFPQVIWSRGSASSSAGAPVPNEAAPTNSLPQKPSPTPFGTVLGLSSDLVDEDDHFHSTTTPVHALIIGDSHTSAYIFLVEELLRRAEKRGLWLAEPGRMPMILNSAEPEDTSSYNDPPTRNDINNTTSIAGDDEHWFDRWGDALQRHWFSLKAEEAKIKQVWNAQTGMLRKLRYLVVSCAWRSKFAGNNRNKNHLPYLLNTLRYFLNVVGVAKVVLVHDYPQLPWRLKAWCGFASHSFFGGGLEEDCRYPRKEVRLRRGQNLYNGTKDEEELFQTIQKEFGKDKIKTWNPVTGSEFTDLFCDEEYCYTYYPRGGGGRTSTTASDKNEHLKSSWSWSGGEQSSASGVASALAVNQFLFPNDPIVKSSQKLGVQWEWSGHGNSFYYAPAKAEIFSKSKSGGSSIQEDKNVLVGGGRGSETIERKAVIPIYFDGAHLPETGAWLLAEHYLRDPHAWNPFEE